MIRLPSFFILVGFIDWHNSLNTKLNEQGFETSMLIKDIRVKLAQFAVKEITLVIENINAPAD